MTCTSVPRYEESSEMLSYLQHIVCTPSHTLQPFKTQIYDLRDHVQFTLLLALHIGNHHAVASLTGDDASPFHCSPCHTAPLQCWLDWVQGTTLILLPASQWVSPADHAPTACKAVPLNQCWDKPAAFARSGAFPLPSLTTEQVCQECRCRDPFTARGEAHRSAAHIKRAT